MSWDRHKCKCGQVYWIYVPMKLVLEEAGVYGPERIREWGEIDERARKSGEIEVMKKFTEKTGDKFVDVRVNRVLHCECKERYDPLGFLSEESKRGI